MNHIPEGRLQAHVEGWLPREERREVERHLDGCRACSTVRQELEGLRRLARHATGELRPTPDIEGAWRKMMQRVRTRRRRTRRRRALVAGLIAAVLVGVSAFALPASPLYGYAGRAWERIVALFADDPEGEPLDVPPAVETEPLAPPPPPPEEPAAAPPVPPPEAGLFLDAAREPVQIALYDALPGTEIRVVLVEGSEAGVIASAASRFRSEPGRLDVAVRGASIRVEIPRRAEHVLLLVQGEVLLLKDGESLDVRGSVASRGPEEIRFLIPGG